MAETIRNEKLELSFNLHGGSLTSIKNIITGEEYLYQKDPRSWQGQDVAIFPFIARLKDKTYTVDGVTYSMENHGLCRYNDFDVVEIKDNKAVISFSSNEETLKRYPFEFTFEITYTLIDNEVKVEFDIYNEDEKTLYFGVGAHPALKVFAIDSEEETDISGNKIVFDKKEQLTQMLLDEAGSFIIGEKEYGEYKEIELSKEFFRNVNTLIIKANDIHHITLVRKDGKVIDYSFPYADYYAIWSHPKYGDYVCVEPWMSLPDFADAPKELKEKKTLQSLLKGERYHFEYSMKICD